MTRRKLKKLISIILCICFVLLELPVIHVQAAPSDFSIIYNDQVKANNDSIHYEYDSVTIGIKVPDASDFYALIDAPNVSLSYDGGEYNEYTLTNPSGPVTITVVADDNTLPAKVINFYRNTNASEGVTYTYASYELAVTSISGYPLPNIETISYIGESLDQDEVNSLFYKYQDSFGLTVNGQYNLDGWVRVRIFDQYSNQVGEYECGGNRVYGIKQGQPISGIQRNLYDSEWGWIGTTTEDFYTRANWRALVTYTAPPITPTPTPTSTSSTPTPTPTATSTVTPSPGTPPTLGIDASPKLVKPGESYTVIDKCTSSSKITNWIVTEAFKSKTGQESFIIFNQDISNASDFFKQYTKADEGEYTYYISKVTDSNGLSTAGLVSVTVKVDAGATPVPTVTPTPTPSTPHSPPVAKINASAQIEVGENVSISGRQSYDIDGKIIDFAWDIPGAIESITGDFGYTYFKKTGTYIITLTVTDNDGLTNTTTKQIKVVPPTPVAKIDVTGDLKENRKVNISSEGSRGNDMYPIDDTKTQWTITPVSGGTSADIKYSGSLTGSKTKDTLFKMAGQYKITLKVTNTYGTSATTEQTITISPDIAPIGNITVSSPQYRNPSNSKIATFNIYDMSYSTDNDFISSHTWKYAYDTDNDGDFSDEVWHTFNTGNNLNVQLNVSEVGKYKIVEDIVEGFGQPTIAEFITQADYRTAQAEKIIEVQNVAPVTSFGIQKKQPVDISVLTDYTGSKLTDLTNSLNALKSSLAASNVDVNINMVDGNNRQPIGSVVTSKHVFRTYNFDNVFYGVDYNNNFYAYDRYNNGAMAKSFLSTDMSKIPGNLKGFVAKMDDYGKQFAAYTNDGKLYGWGYTNKNSNTYYCPWIPIEYEQYSVPEPKLYTEIDNVEDVELGGYNSLFALKKDGTVWANGFPVNNFGTPQSYTPHVYYPFERINQFDGTKDLVSTDSGSDVFAVKNDGTVWVFGVLTNFLTPGVKEVYQSGVLVPYQQIPNIDNVDKLFVVQTINGDTVFIVKKDGSVWTWGGYIDKTGVNYELYNNQKLYVTTPKQVPNLNGSDIKNMVSHKNTKDNTSDVYMLKSNGTVWQFTSNGNIEQVKTLYNSNYHQDSDDIYRWDSDTAVVNLSDVAAMWEGKITTDGYYDDRTGNPPIFVQFKDGSVYSNWYGDDYNHDHLKLHKTVYYGKFGGLANIEAVNSSTVENYTPRANSDRYFINVTDGAGENYSSGFGNYYSLGCLKNSIVNYLNNNNFTTYITAPSSSYDYISPYGKQEISLRAIMNQSVNQGGLYDSGQYNQILNAIKSKYGTPQAVTQYALVNDQLTYNTSYSDTEGDPMIASRWKTTHTDPNYFDNGYGTMPGSGSYTGSPVNSFSKPGKYEITYSARDNPKNDSRFDNYKFWSNENLSKLTLLIHRRPIAQFNAAFTGKDGSGNYIPTFADMSFDWDHTSRIDRGIQARQWKYKEINASSWTPGLPTSVPAGQTYMISLIVQDLEGVWSYPFTKTITATGLNLTPTVDANPPYYGWTNQNITVTVTANDSGENDFNRTTYKTSDDTTDPGTTDGTMYQKVFPLTYTAEGSWYLHMHVYDNAGNTFYRFRGPYLIDKTPPGLTATPYQANWTNQDVTVTLSPWDALSGVQKWRYVASDNGGASWGDWTGYSWGPVDSTVTLNYEGRHIIKSEITDNAGNVSYVTTGSYLIDKTPPTITPDKEGPLEATGSITVNLTLDDNLSGVKLTRYCFTDSTDTPSEDEWLTSTEPVIAATQTQGGTWYLHVECEDNAGNVSYKTLGSYTVIDFTVAATLVPNPALAGDELIFTVNTTGFVDKIVIFVDQDIIDKDDRSQYSYPLEYEVDGSVDVKTTDIRYILCVKTDQTLTKDDVRLRPEYTFIVRGYRGDKHKDVVLPLDVRRSVLELIHPGVLQN